MSVRQFIVGATRPIWTVTVKNADGSAFDLTGYTLTGVMKDVASSLSVTLAGTFALTNASGGVFTYTPVAGDVDEPGVFEVTYTATNGSAIAKMREPVKGVK